MCNWCYVLFCSYRINTSQKFDWWKYVIFVRLDTVCFLVILCLLVLYHRSGLRGIIVKCICLDLMCQFCFMCLVSFVNHNTVICHITYSRNIVLHFLPTKRVAWSMGIVLHCIYTLLASIICISFLSLVCQYLYLFNCHDLASSPSVGLFQQAFCFFMAVFWFIIIWL